MIRFTIKFLLAFLSGIALRKSFFFGNWYLGGSIKTLNNIEIDGNMIVSANGNQLSKELSKIFFPRLDWFTWVMNNFKCDVVDNTVVLDYTSISGDKCLLPVRSLGDVSVIIELFKDKIYDWVPPRKAIMIDFGMNHGLTSISAAASGRFSRIYAYELVPETYKIATQNIALNEGLKDLIVPYNIAVGKHEGSINVGGVDEGSVTASIYQSHNKNAPDIFVPIKPAGRELNEILSRHPNTLVFLKMDVEGAELDVIQSFVDYNCLQHISAMIVECHNGLEVPLLKILLENNFTCKTYPVPANYPILFAQYFNRC